MSPHTTDLLVPSTNTLSGMTATTADKATSSEKFDADAVDTELSYRSVPPQKSHTMLVRYRYRGRGLPLPYFLDEETDE